jgi:hypothetical protein
MEWQRQITRTPAGLYAATLSGFLVGTHGGGMMEGPPGGRALLDFGCLFSEEQAAEVWLETLEQVLTSHPVTIELTPLPKASDIAEGEGG